MLFKYRCILDDRCILLAIMSHMRNHASAPHRGHSTHKTLRTNERSDEYGELQHLVDELYQGNMSGSVSSIDVITRGEVDDLGSDLMEVLELLPSGSYKRARLCDQLNSIITAHGWGYTYGTVEQACIYILPSAEKAKGASGCTGAPLLHEHLYL